MSSVQDLTCIFCKESFEDKETLQIHFRKHADPMFNQTVKPKSRIQNELATTSDSSKDENDMVSCDVCSEMFPTISKAITHKHKVHPDHEAKYFCPWCGKLFTLKHLYNKHLESNHDSLSSGVTRYFHCDCCDVDFFLPSAMVYHNKCFHRQDKDILSIGYSKKVKLICQELVQIYYCSFCGEEYENKVNLRKHTIDEHNDENQSPEDILRCPLCEAIFYHLDAYELHLTFHSSEDLYNEENDVIKEITEFSLDTIPPLMEKLENPGVNGDNEDLNAISIDQFLQLSMSKEPEDEQIELQTEKIKSKKHKKHKKSKKSITLDEFLNMNKDVFGEGLNFQGIEEVPTRVVTKQLKPKKEYGLKSSQKITALPTNLDKLKKQGIIIKRKGDKKPVSTSCSSLLVSSQDETSSLKPIKVSPSNSNTISTSSDVLSKLMSQSNSQIKVIKKTVVNNNSPEQLANEKIVSKDPINELQENNFSKNDQNLDNDVSDNINTDKSVQDSTFDSYDPPKEDIKENNNQNTVHAGTISGSKETIPNTLKDNINQTNDDNLNYNLNAIEYVNTPEISSNSGINKKNVIEKSQTLNDFEDVASKKTLFSDISENQQFDSSKESETNISNETTVQNNREVFNNKSNFVKDLKHIITGNSVNHSKSSEMDDGAEAHIWDNKIVSSSHEINNQEIKDNFDDRVKDNSSLGCKVDTKKISSSETRDVLKNISKHVTIKPLTSEVTSPKTIRNFCAEDSEAENLNELTSKISAKKIVGRKVANLKSQNQPDVAIRFSQIHSPSKRLPQNIKKIQDSVTSSISNMESVKFNVSNADILKRLKNVTAKPIASTLNMKQETLQTSIHMLNTQKENLVEKVTTTQEKINEEIEIFNIDDSDSDSQDNNFDNGENKTSTFSFKSDNKKKNSITVNTSHEALRNISKNVTIKSMNKESRNNSSFNYGANLSEQSTSFSDEDGNTNNNEKRSNKSLNQPNKNLQSKLKRLSNQITVKSRNSSPNILPRQTPDQNVQNNDNVFGYDTGSDSDSPVGNVTITEMTENGFSDNELQSDEDDTKQDKNKFVHSPTSTNSDVDHNFADDENNKQWSDVDNEQDTMKVNLSQTLESEQCPINNLKKFNKEITIKSMNGKNISNMCNKVKNTIEDSDTINNKELPVRVLRLNIPQRNISEIPTSTTDKVGNISNQVNKEVSVKTFQSQTVIEEITTTVTKTIRTVNKSINQEITNTNHTSSVSAITPQKNPSHNQQNKNSIKTTRQPSLSVGTRIKNNTNSKPSSQLVPVLPGTQLKKLVTTAAPVKNITPRKPAQQKPIAGRALKISPQAMNQTIKRTSAEPAGHFSCFKKPKELPLEAPTLRDDHDGDASMHFSATQSKSDFSSILKNVKGKSLVASTQVKSVISNNSQLSRLGNMSVMKTVKSSSRQATHVEEKIENNENKRAMEALEKLQMQGLLIKRPRTDDYEENTYSNSGSESEEGC